METKIDFVTITSYEYNKLKYDIEELKKQVEYYKNDKDFCWEQIRSNRETNDYFRESASYWRKRASNSTNHHKSRVKNQSKSNKLIEEIIKK